MWLDTVPSVSFADMFEHLLLTAKQKFLNVQLFPHNQVFHTPPGSQFVWL